MTPNPYLTPAIACIFAMLGCADGGDGADDGQDDDLSGPAPLLCQVELTCDGPIEDEPKRDCALRVEDGSGVEIYDDRVAIERRGRSSMQYDKPNYGLELRDAAGAEKPTNLLGMGGESDWILDGSWVDRSFLRNELAFALFRSLDPRNWAPRGRFCEVGLNDEPRGIYRLGERIKKDDDRVAIPEDDGTGQSFVVKQDREGALEWDVGEQRTWKLVSPNEDRATPEQVRGVQEFLDSLDDALRNTDPEQPSKDPFGLLDLDALVDFVIVEELSKNADAYNLSLHLWKAPGAPAGLVPWDFDLSMGQPDSADRPGNELPSGSGFAPDAAQRRSRPALRFPDPPRGALARAPTRASFGRGHLPSHRSRTRDARAGRPGGELPAMAAR